MGEQVEIVRVLVAQVAVQVALALIVTGILGAFHRLYRQTYLRHWSLSWLALAVYVGATLAAGVAGRGPLRLVAVVVTLVAGYLQVGRTSRPAGSSEPSSSRWR